MTQAIQVPDIGTRDAVEIIEISVKPGDRFAKDDTLIVLESDKATMEIPAPHEGVVGELKVKVGDSVRTGDTILLLAEGSVAGKADMPPSTTPSAVETVPAAIQPVPSSPHVETASPAPSPAAIPSVTAELPVSSQSVSPSSALPVGSPTAPVHAGPAVRRLARELGVDLAQVTGSGPRQRILKDDVHAWVKNRLARPAALTGNGLPPLPSVDFASWGPIDTQPLSRINRLSAANLHRAWVHIPHVTQFDEADVTDLEAFRKAEAEAFKQEGVRLTMLAFLVKAVTRTLAEFPRFNSSLSTDGESLVLKRYMHIGIAVDTPNGLVVPVVRDADRKTVVDIAREMQTLGTRARDRKLSPADMQGGSFSISSLGGIGGTAFTPIVNWPEVAILGVSRMQTRPVWDGKAFAPRQLLPLSLSYDHRVIDGADAARFTSFLARQLGDIRRLLL